MNLSDLHSALIKALKDDIDVNGSPVNWYADGLRFSYIERTSALQSAIARVVKENKALYPNFNRSIILLNGTVTNNRVVFPPPQETVLTVNRGEITASYLDGGVPLTYQSGVDIIPLGYESTDLWNWATNGLIIPLLSKPLMKFNTNEFIVLLPYPNRIWQDATLNIHGTAIPVYGIPNANDTSIPIDGAVAGDVILYATQLLLEKARMN
jgi:hypothetical protein